MLASGDVPISASVWKPSAKSHYRQKVHEPYLHWSIKKIVFVTRSALVAWPCVLGWKSACLALAGSLDLEDSLRTSVFGVAF